MSQRVSTRPRPGPPAPPRGRWSRGWRRWVRWLVTLGAVLFVLGLVGFAYAYAAIDVPDPNEGFETQTTYVYYADGRTELGKFAEQDRTSVPLEQIPLHVQEAVIAAEDRSFRTNQGIDPKGILRAAFNNARGGSTQGASTITQQYVKVLYLTQDRTFTRKLKEAVLSLKIQREKSKDEILEGYLNTIYFGRGAYGIEAAARAYFGTSARQLNVSQGAVLASVLNSPSYLDPANGPDSRRALLARYRYVVDAMAETGALPVGVSAREARRLPVFPEVRQQSQNGGQRGHVLRLVREELTRLGFSESEIYGGGLRITTTLTRSAMAAAQQGVFQERPRLPELHVAAASIDPQSGALRGMYAGQDYLDSQLNWAEAGGAPGSAFKPFALAAGLSYGYALSSTFEGNSPLVIGSDEFENQGEDGGTDYGSAVSLLDATEESVNTAYIDLVASMDDGVEKVIDTAVDLGVPEDAPGLEPNFSTVLGSATVSPLDMANAFGTIAAGGRAKEWYLVEAVEGSDGEVQFKQRVRTTQAVSEDVAADTSYALQQVAQVGTGTNAQLADRPIAGKTGTATTDDGRVRSSWFVGYTPQLATAVMYVRGNGNAPLDGYLDTFYGGQHPALTWQAIMTRALAGAEVVPFPPPANLEQTAEGHEAFTPAPSPTEAPPAPSPTRTSAPPSDTPSPSPSPSDSPTPTPEPSPTPSPSPSPTAGPTATPTRTPTPTAGPTRTPSPTATGGGGGGGG